jgi:hypothetical protein
LIIGDHFGYFRHLEKWQILTGATLDYQQICVKQLFLRSPPGDVSVEILQDFFLNANLVFRHHFGFIYWLTIFA